MRNGVNAAASGNGVKQYPPVETGWGIKRGELFLLSRSRISIAIMLAVAGSFALGSGSVRANGGNGATVLGVGLGGTGGTDGSPSSATGQDGAAGGARGVYGTSVVLGTAGAAGTVGMVVTTQTSISTTVSGGTGQAGQAAVANVNSDGGNGGGGAGVQATADVTVTGTGTGDGILLVQVNGTSAANSFRLAAPVQAGAYQYLLYQGGATDANGWYLRSQFATAQAASSNPGDPAAAPATTGPVAYRPAVVGYSVTPLLNAEYDFSILDRLQERVGDVTSVDSAEPAHGNGV